MFTDIAGYDTIILNGRGDLERTERFSETDLAVRHRYKFGRDGRFTLVGEVDVLNLFNQNGELGRFTRIDQLVYNLEDPANGLVTAAEAASLSSAALLRLAQQRLTQNGAPSIVSQANDAANRDPRFNLTDVFQPGRTIRFGVRLMF